MQNFSKNIFSLHHNYRYAYNGMEKDDEVSGNGNSYTTQFRQYDPRLGRWKSLDPLAGKYPGQSPFVGFNDNPIYFVDPLGLEGTEGGEGGGGKSAEVAEGVEPKHGDLRTTDFTDGSQKVEWYNSKTGQWEYVGVPAPSGKIYAGRETVGQSEERPGGNALDLASGSTSKYNSESALVKLSDGFYNDIGKSNDYLFS